MNRELELQKQISEEVQVILPAVLKALKGVSPVVAMNALYAAMTIVNATVYGEKNEQVRDLP